ncbi:MAG: biotin/lipoyl-binding protein, partial [Oscillibacter sp.]|nr:biotin/lipoyl-binding protein [Oscillibacter sp.]
MADVYRKSLLEKLSSPDQLDKMIVIISPSFWVAAMGGAVIIAAAVIWSLVGRLPVNVSTSGIYMVRGGIHAVYAETSGTVDTVLVSEGATVTKGEALVHLDSRQAQENVSALEERRSSVEAVTFESENDAAGVDNKSLLDIKAQKIVSSVQLRADQALLEQRQRDIRTQDGRVSDTQAKFESAQAAYFASIGTDLTSPAQIAYQSAQTELANSRSYFENAKASLSQVRTSGATLESQRAKAEADLAAAREELEQAQADFDAARDAMFAAQNDQQAAQARLTEAQTALTSAQTALSTAFSEKSTAESMLASARANEDAADS